MPWPFPQFLVFGFQLNYVVMYKLCHGRSYMSQLFVSKSCWLAWLLIHCCEKRFPMSSLQIEAEWRSQRYWYTRKRNDSVTTFQRKHWFFTELFWICFLVVVFLGKKHHGPFEKSQASLATTTTISCRRNLGCCRCKCLGSSSVQWLCSGQLGFEGKGWDMFGCLVAS